VPSINTSTFAGEQYMKKKYNRHIHVTLIVKILFLSAEISMERNGKLHRNVLSSSSKAYMSLTSHYRHTYFRML
jgi:hypothetical protein